MSDHLAAKPDQASSAAPLAVNLTAVHHQLEGWKSEFGAAFLLALSGGSDSLALCHLLADWAGDAGAHVHVVSVDHGLRPTSRADAEQAMAWAKALGLTGEIVSLEGQPASGVQEWARRARYQKLDQIAQNVGARVILLGHTRDDQAETIAWRLSRDSGLDGLAGMASLAINPAATSQPQSLLGRPLLDLKRADLRAWLEDRGQSWLEDDSNQNLRFARVRTRQKLGALKEVGGDVDAFVRIGALAEELRRAQEAACEALLSRSNLGFVGDGWTLAAGPFFNSNALLVERALGWLIQSLSGIDHAPDTDKLSRLRHALTTDQPGRRTLAGLVMTIRHGQFIIQPAPPRRGQKPNIIQSEAGARARLAAVSRQTHRFVTEPARILSQDGLTSTR